MLGGIMMDSVGLLKKQKCELVSLHPHLKIEKTMFPYVGTIPLVWLWRYLRTEKFRGPKWQNLMDLHSSARFWPVFEPKPP